MNIFRISLLLILPLIVSCSARSAPGIDYQNPSLDDVPILITQMVSGQEMELQNKAKGALDIIVAMDGGLEALVDLLSTGDSGQRKDTAIYIGYAVRTSLIQYKQDPALLPTLEDALTDEDESVRLAVCDALGWIALTEAYLDHSPPFGDSTVEVVRSLLPLLEDQNPDIRAKAANTLCDIGPSANDAVDALSPLLSDEDFLVRLDAAVALAQIEPSITEAIPVLIEGASSSETEYGHRPLPSLDGRVPADVHRASAQALALIGPQAISALPALLGLFCDPDSATQDAAVSAVFAIDPTGEVAVPALIELLSDECSDARGNSARTLILIGPPGREAIPALQNLLEDPDGWVREQASQAIAAIQAE